MQVPGEMVREAQDAHQTKGAWTPEERMRMALEAVLPMVRERLGDHETPDSDLFEIWQSAFPEDES